MISVILLTTTVAFVSGVDLNGYQNELDFYGNPFAADAYLSWNPFASPPYSWEQLDVTSDIGKAVNHMAEFSINERLANKGINPVQMIAPTAIWTRNSKTNTDPKTSAVSYIAFNYLAIPLNDTIFECMTPVQEVTSSGENGAQKSNARYFNSTCRPINMRNCQSDLAENKLVLNTHSPAVLRARQAISDYIDTTLNPQNFEQLSYKVDVLMGVTCAYQQDTKICLDLYEQRISDVDVELRSCYRCVEDGIDSWDFGTETCSPGNSYMID